MTFDARSRARDANLSLQHILAALVYKRYTLRSAANFKSYVNACFFLAVFTILSNVYAWGVWGVCDYFFG